MEAVRGRSVAFALIDLMLTVGLVALLAGAAGALALSSRPLGAGDAAARLATLFDAARAQAAADGDGATILFSRAAYGEGFVAALYRHRPLPGTELAPAGIEPYASSARIALAGVAQEPPFAIFVDGTGSVGAAAWDIGQGALATEPQCVVALELTIAAEGGRVERRSVPCAQATLR
ncbi:hypothetical protein EPN44_12465 [bacterium]|nr:MAG: hypothetical protein EPN44_12465 [bacterium]